MAKQKRPEWKDSDAPDANGKFKELNCDALADWLIKSRKGNKKKIVGSLNQQIVFNRKRNPSYAKKMKCARNASKKTPMLHCAATVMHSKPWNKMRNRTAAVAGRGDGNKVGIEHNEKLRTSPFSKQKGGGTSKTCLPAAKVRSMSKEAREKLVNAKKSAAAKGNYKRSSSSNVSGARKPGATLRDWFENENWVRVDDPSKKCGE